MSTRRGAMVAIAQATGLLPIPRVALAGRGGWPGTTTTTTNNVSTTDSLYVAPPGGVGDQIAIYGNYFLTNGGRSSTGLAAFTASGATRVNGVVTRWKWGATPDAAMNGADSIVVNPGDDVWVYIPAINAAAGALVHERVTEVGAAGNLPRLTNVGTRRTRYEGAVRTAVTDLVASQQAWTDGNDCVIVAPARDPATGFITLPGSGTAAAVASTGTGWVAPASSLLLVDPVDGTIATVGNTNSARTTATMNAGAGSTRYWNPGSYFIAVPAVGSDSSGHALHARFGVKRPGAGLSRGFVTDSVGRAFAAGDNFGDAKGNYGILERAFDSNGGFTSMGVIGNTATAHRTWFPTSNLRSIIQTANVLFDEVYLLLLNNDIAGGVSTLAGLKAAMAEIAAYWQSRGARVILCTIPPRSSTTDGQTPLTPGFVSGGLRDVCNAEIRGNTMVPNQRGYMEIATPLEDPADHSKYKVGFTTDGIHPNDAAIQYALTQQMFYPS